MNQIVNDWEKFCEGRESFDKSHFYTLFWEGITRSDLDLIFKYFPKSHELVERTNDYLFGKREEVSNETTISEASIKLAIHDINEKKSIIGSNSHLLRVTQQFKVEFIEDFESISRLKTLPPNIEFFDAINDVLSENWIIEDRKAFALHEAFYGLTNDYEMVWYLFSPLYKTNVDFSNYYKLTVLGGIYAITDNQILVSQRSITTV